jgi:hypothetical protein
VQAGTAFFAGADVGNVARGVVAQGGREGLAGHLADQTLARAHGLRAVGDDGLHQLVHGGVQRIGFDHLMQQAQMMSLCCIEALGGDEVAAYRALTDGTQHIGADGGGREAQLDFRQAEAHGKRAHGDVAGCDQAHATAVAVTLYAGNHRHRAAGNGPQHVGQAGGVGMVLVPAVAGHFAHPVQVGTGAKGLAVGTQHHHAQAGAGGELGEALRQLGNRGGIEGVAQRRAVQPYMADGAFMADLQVRHGGRPHMRKTP